MDYGIKASKQGEDIFSAAIKNQRLNTGKGALKIFMAGNVSLTTNGSGNATASVSHALGYAPAFLVFRKETANWNFLSGGTDYPNAFFPVGSPNFYVKNDSLHHAIHAYADANNLYIQVSGGAPSRAMNFRYYILVDLSEAFSGADNISLDNDYGFKASKEGFDVLTAKEYQMTFSTKYKILQYYGVNRKAETLTLPAMWASYYDDFVEEATYVDFNHGLGYAPLFIAHVTSPTLGNRVVQVPITFLNGIDTFGYGVSGFSDATRIRIYFWRSSIFFAGTIYDTWPDETVTIRIYPIAEDLAGASFPP